MNKSFFTLVFLFAVASLSAQNLFPKKLDNCVTDRFCLDCGSTKANVDKTKFSELIDDLNASNNLDGLKGKVMFQILLDSTANGCVLSHTDVSENKITRNIVLALNRFDGFIPASTDGKPERKVSFNMSFEISDGTIKGKVERVDMDAFKKSFDHPQKPEIFNKDYNYKNEHLKDYKISVWNSENSNLPNNRTDCISVDKTGTIWLTIDDGLVTFNGRKFQHNEQDITSKGKFFGYSAVATDNNDIKWVFGKDNVYSYNNKKWTIYDPKDIYGVDGGYDIINNPKTGEVFFCSDEGLTIYLDGVWSNINQEKVSGLPSNRVNFAKRDSKNNIWIGTYSGTAMIDPKGKITNFETTSTILKGKCITSMDEDENGTLYFSLYEFNRKDKKEINNDEGILIRNSDGTMSQRTTSNSGMPFNHATCVLYDKKEKVLWISTDRSGLVRYDLKDGWENYHSDNSEIPTSYISTMTFDNNGILCLATRQGLVKMEKK